MEAEGNTTGTGTFVGRGPELERVHLALRDAVSGRGQVVLVRGDPGIGKTRLAKEAAAVADHLGLSVMWGRCWESGGAPSFWPWVQALRTYARTVGTEDVLGTAGGRDLLDLAAIVGVARMPGEAGSVHPQEMRFALFDATVRFLRAAVAAQPALLILDDVHAADADSLLLLQFIAREVERIGLVVLVTYREADARARPAIAGLLDAVARDTLMLSLSGWSEAEVAEFVVRTLHAPIAAPRVRKQLARVLTVATEGNPFFIEEILSAWNADGRCPLPDAQGALHLRIPEHVRTAVRHRFALLPDACREVLRVASVVGREFDLPVLARALGTQAVAELTDLLASAVGSGVITPAVAAPGTYAFSHVLLRDTLYHDLPASHRATLHATVAQAIEHVHAEALLAHAADLAHHYCAVASAESAAQAIRYSVAAAQQAALNCAYADAVSHSRNALNALTLLPARGVAGRRQQRCRLLLKLGGMLNAAGQRPEARETFRQAADLARRLRDPQALGYAALGYGGAWVGSTELLSLNPPGEAEFDDFLARLLREALDMLGDAHPALRARLLSRLAVERYFTTGASYREALVQEAVTIAREGNDPRTLAVVLCDSHFATWGPDNVHARLAVAEEVIALAEGIGDYGLRLAGHAWQLADLIELGIGDYGLRLAGHAWQLADLIELGDGPRVEAAFDALRRQAETYRQPAYLWVMRVYAATLALLHGDYAGGEAWAQEALASSDPPSPGAVIAHTGQMAAIYRECGRFDALEAPEMLLRAFIEQQPQMLYPKALLMHLCLVHGKIEEARSDFECLGPQVFDDLPRDLTWLRTICECAEVCAAVGGRERAATLYRLLLPSAGTAVVGPYNTTCWGAVDRTLGMLATLLEEWGAAETHFVNALTFNRRLKARPWVARTQYDYAAMLAARRCAGDCHRALTLLDDAAAAAQELGMRPLRERTGALAARLRAEAAALGHPATFESPHSPTNRFTFDGEMWTITYAGHSAAFRESRGLRLLALLLREPRRAFHALELVGATTASAGARRPDDACGDLPLSAKLSDAPLDAVKLRLEDLQDELAEARGYNDLGRMQRVQQEMEALLDRLARMPRAGNKAALAASDAERARVNVTRAVAAALKKIRSEHPDLGIHLRETIRTGAVCVYRPDPRVPISWEILV